MNDRDPLDRAEVRWGLGCLLGATAMLGLFILTLLVALALQPPAWVQVLTGIALVAAGATLAWLIATALGRSRETDDRRGPRSL
jgi:hypothetical protein